MNQPKVKELMRLVEQAVRPVCADISSKMKMREELYGHAEEIYRDELQRDGNESTAIARAVARMGDPAELRTELQATISWPERWCAYFSSFFVRRPGESRLHSAFRIAWISALVISLEMFPLLMFEAMDILSWNFRGKFLVRLVPTLISLVAINGFVFTLLGSTLVDHLQAGFVGRRTMVACFGMAFAASLALLTTGAAFTLALCGDVASVQALMPRWYALAVVAAFGSVVICWLSAKEKRRSHEWLTLELEA